MSNKTHAYIIIPESRPLWAMRRCWGPTMGPLPRPINTPVDVIKDLLMQPEPNKLSVYEVKPVSFHQGQPKEFSEPVKLTLENYLMDYDEIAGGTPVPRKTEAKTVDLSDNKKEIKPNVAIPNGNGGKTQLDIKIGVSNQVEEKKPVVPMSMIASVPKNEEQPKPVTTSVVVPKEEIVHDETVTTTVFSDSEDVVVNSPENLPEEVTTGYIAHVEEEKEVEPVEETINETPAPTPEDLFAGLTKSQRKKLRREMRAAENAAEESSDDED